MNIEYIFGKRSSGKTYEIFNSINLIECIGIIVRDKTNACWLKNKIGRIKNVYIISKPEELFGKCFDKVFIDDASFFKWENYLPILKDAMNPEGTGKIFVYFRIPEFANLSTRILTRKRL